MIDIAHVRDQVRAFLIRRSPAARRRGIGDGDALLESGILDSLGVLELLGFLEESFGVAFVDDELVPDNFQTVERIGACVERKLAEREA